MSSNWVSRKEVDKQYRPKGYVSTIHTHTSSSSLKKSHSSFLCTYTQGLSPGLQRARAPFRTRNAITGVAIGAFVFGVWAYSISAVKQDTFEDLDDEAKELLAARMADERIRKQEAQLKNEGSGAGKK